MNRLEAWHEAQNLTKTAMASKLGANTSQQYTNWLARNSLPKKYMVKAAEILGEEFAGVLPPTTETDVEALARAVLDASSIEQAHRIARLVLRK